MLKKFGEEIEQDFQAGKVIEAPGYKMLLKVVWFVDVGVHLGFVPPSMVEASVC